MTKKEFVNLMENLFLKNDMETYLGDKYSEFFEYWNEFSCSTMTTKEGLTDNGKNILSYMQSNKDSYSNAFTAKSIGEGIGISSRSVSGAIRKLVTEGYVEKIGSNPVTYSITDKGIAEQI